MPSWPFIFRRISFVTEAINAIFILVACVMYITGATSLAVRLAKRKMEASKLQPLIFGLTGALFHAVLLQQAIMTSTGLNLGFTNMLSLATWFVAGLFIVTAFRKPIENMGIMILPLAAIMLCIQVLVPTSHILSPAESKGLGVHILFSILAYSLLGMAAVQAILLSFQERSLHNRHPGGIVRALPPMETMEGLLFQLIIIGFALQSMSLLSGFIYLEDMFAQHLVHKTVLSIIAWAVFAVLLFGHWRFGWRGRTAVRWTLSGFFTLLLAYFGSKYVLEIILER
jgi:ABC-type uncharacterized transport system permease subunit